MKVLPEISIPLEIVFAVLLVNHVGAILINPEKNPDVDLKTTELLNKYGYPTETHHIVTEDGYILETHRIVGVMENGNYRSPWREGVLLVHGLAGSSADWVLAGPEKGLGNSRGNLYSRNHTTLSPSERSFWDFSWHEMGVFDLPATIDYILAESCNEKIFYIGHSQGTTQFWVMASERPDYNSKIILMTAFAPAAFTANLRGPVTKLAKLTRIGVWVGENFGYPEFTERSTWAKFVSNIICRDSSFTQFFCSTIIFLIAGWSPDELNSTIVPVIVGHVSAGASWKQFIHYGQGTMEQGRFRYFDYYNDEKNFNLYNSTVPPEYRLENIRAPVAFFNSENDWLATPKDVSLLETRIQNLVLVYRVATNSFNHYDFLWGTNAPALIYQRLFKLMEEYST
ncbi:lipase 1-like isoform X2 [Athalia rosae]|uniref:lipase 1-like isoform X2 n=1 Tax=Athalia rosae TaxID=37344 RepID=UPI00203488B2|nr:lipase 1-like isoform X2 [Athalia rosae]